MFWPCGFLDFQPEIEPMPSTLEALSLNHWTASEVPFSTSYVMDSSARNSGFYVPDPLCHSASPVWGVFWDGEGFCRLLGHLLIQVSSYPGGLPEKA